MAWLANINKNNNNYDVRTLKGVNAKECLLSLVPPTIKFEHSVADLLGVKVALSEVINRLQDVGVLADDDNRPVSLSTQLAKTSPHFAERVIRREDLLNDGVVLSHAEYRILNYMYTHWHTIFNTMQNKIHYFDFIQAYLRTERELNL